MEPTLGLLDTLQLRATKKVIQTDDLPLLCEWMDDVVTVGSLIVLERPFRGSTAGNIDTAVRLAQVAGGLIARHRGPAIQVVPSVWKKAVVGNGGAKKPAIRKWVERTHPEIAALILGRPGRRNPPVAATHQEDEDLFDAACMGLYGYMHSRGELEAPR